MKITANNSQAAVYSFLLAQTSYQPCANPKAVSATPYELDFASTDPAFSRYIPARQIPDAPEISNLLDRLARLKVIQYI